MIPSNYILTKCKTLRFTGMQEFGAVLFLFDEVQVVNHSQQ